MSWTYRELEDSTSPLDEQWFVHNPGRQCMVRRPICEDERATVDPEHAEKVDVLVFVRKCPGGCPNLHRTSYIFTGKCLRFNLHCDDAVIQSLYMIMANPDGKGN